MLVFKEAMDLLVSFPYLLFCHFLQVMADLLAVCSNHDCRLFLSGISPSLALTLQLGGVKPDMSTRDRSKRKLRFFPDLDSAVGKAEDVLIKFFYRSNHDEQSSRHLIQETGFERCLSHIDNQVSRLIILCLQ